MVKMTKSLILFLVLLLSFNVLIQHANCTRVLKQANDHPNLMMSKWIEEKTKLFFQVLSTGSPTPPSSPNPTCHIPVCI